MVPWVPTLGGCPSVVNQRVTNMGSGPHGVKPFLSCPPSRPAPPTIAQPMPALWSRHGVPLDISGLTPIMQNATFLAFCKHRLVPSFVSIFVFISKFGSIIVYTIVSNCVSIVVCKCPSFDPVLGSIAGTFFHP
jgi:hypothetical protein